MSITIAQICDAVAATLATAVDYAYSYDELTEGINDQGVLEVYWEAFNADPAGRTDRTSFQGATRQTDITIHADYYARQRSHIAEDMAKLTAGIDAIWDVLEAQDTKPYFGLEGIRAFAWSATRVTFQRADPSTPYAGARFVLTFRTF